MVFFEIILGNKNNPFPGLSFSGSPDRGTDRTLSALLSQLFVYFKKNDITPESEGKEQNQINLSLDRSILISMEITTSVDKGWKNATLS